MLRLFLTHLVSPVWSSRPSNVPSLCELALSVWAVDGASSLRSSTHTLLRDRHAFDEHLSARCSHRSRSGHTHSPPKPWQLITSRATEPTILTGWLWASLREVMGFYCLESLPTSHKHTCTPASKFLDSHRKDPETETGRHDSPNEGLKTVKEKEKKE